MRELLDNHDDGLDGNRQLKTWIVKKKLFPKNSVEPPAAKKDGKGNLITSKTSLENLYLNTYAERLTPNEVENGYEDLKNLQDELFELRKQLAATNISEDWTMVELDKILKV